MDKYDEVAKKIYGGQDGSGRLGRIAAYREELQSKLPAKPEPRGDARQLAKALGDVRAKAADAVELEDDELDEISGMDRVMKAVEDATTEWLAAILAHEAPKAAE